MIKLIIDPGSCHSGKLEYAKEFIDRAKEMGAYAVKFQLFGDEFAKNGNIKFPKEWFPELVEYADNEIIVTASVFDEENLEFIIRQKVPFIKFAYSQKHQIEWQRKVLAANIKAIVSCDVMSDSKVLLGCQRLFCISSYPVLYEVNFDGLFPRFLGFSSHCLGTRQDENAIMSGARMIEKHMTLDHSDIDCGDHNFALTPTQMQRLSEFCRNST